MAPKELEGLTLGEKHRHYNKLLQDNINVHKPITEINSADSDVDNLLKIDMASHNKDVQYILNVLKSDDMLYVSRAIAKSTWLITDQQYADIINPDYLQAELYPHMTTKAINKFKKYIRHNIKDETRAEMFYSNEKNKTDAAKWLPHCSVEFIEKKIEDHIKSSRGSIDQSLFKRLCEKSVSIFEIILNNINCYERDQYLQIVTFLLNTHIDKYLDFLEKNEMSYGYPKLNHKATQLIMKQRPQRVKDNIEKYVFIIHIPIFVKYLKADEVKEFLYTQAKKDLDNRKYSNLKKLFEFKTLKHFIKKIPKNEQYDFVKKVCLRRENEDADKEDLTIGTDAALMKKICATHSYYRQNYAWYQFAPFPEAFDQLTKLMTLSPDDFDKRAMLSVLITCAENLQHIQMILKHYINKFKADNTSHNFEFVTQLLEHTHVSKYDKTTWDILNGLLTNIKIYETPSTLSSSETQIVNSLIIYNALNDLKTPAMVEELFNFNSLKSQKKYMNKDQQDKLFNILYEKLLSKINNPIDNEETFAATVKMIENILILLKDWEKDLLSYPFILDKIKELISLRKKNSWKVSLTCLYSVNKSWRKHMFEESIALWPGEEVCLNALKHEPQLLARYYDEVEKLRTNDSVSLRRLLAKLRVYWPYSLAQQWTDAYLNTVNETTTNGQKAAVRAICTMLPQKELLNLIEKYKPVAPKIDWKHVDDHVFSVQQLIAKNMHLGRPQPIPDAILLYAKGDYLQYALPSLLAIFHNLKFTMNQTYIPKLLDAPVSVQKHGIRFAFKNIDRNKLREIFLNCWKTSKNATIRSIIFKYTFTLLCNENDATNAASLWELLELFIDNLTFAEDKDIYRLLREVEKVPLCVRPKFLIKSYNFLLKLIPNVDESYRSQYQYYCTHLAEYSKEVMETINLDFVTSLIQEYYEDFFNSGEKISRSVYHSDNILSVISAYVLCTTDENDQIQRYEKIILPMMHRSFEKWAEKRNGNYFIRKHLQQMLTCLSYDLKEYVIPKKMIIPLKMFTLIQVELEKNLSISENYLMLTKWKLTVALTKLVRESSTGEEEWNGKFGREFGTICLEYLKNDVTLHFPCIYVLFSKCVKEVTRHIMPKPAVLEFYDSMLSDKDFIQGYLSSIEIGLDFRRDEEYDKIWKQVCSHPSVEVKMHYYSKIDIQEIY